MSRRYEDPYVLEEQLKEMQKELEQCIDEDAQISLACEIEELKERINFAWQDDEYETEEE